MIDKYDAGEHNSMSPPYLEYDHSNEKMSPEAIEKAVAAATSELRAENERYRKALEKLRNMPLPPYGGLSRDKHIRNGAAAMYVAQRIAKAALEKEGE